MTRDQIVMRWRPFQDWSTPNAKKQDTKELRMCAMPARAKCTVECHSDTLLMTGQCTLPH